MPFTGNEGDGTEGNPWRVTTKAQVHEIFNPSMSANGDRYRFDQVVDLEGETLQRLVAFASHVDFNGFGIDNIGGISSIQLVRDCVGSFRNGYMEFNVSKAGKCTIFELDPAGVIENVEIKGSLASTDNSCAIVDGAAGGAQVKNLKISADITAATGTAAVILQGQTGIIYDKVIYTGTLGTTNDAALAFNANAGQSIEDMTSCYWDATKNPGISSTGGTGKTTAELQDIDTYTDLTTEGLGIARAGTVSISAASTTVTGTGTDFTSHYSVGDLFRVGVGAGSEVRVIDSITNGTELVVTVAFDDAHTDEDHYNLTDAAYDMVALGSYADEIWAIDDENAYPVLGWSIEAAVLPSGTITDDQAVAVEGAIVDIMSADTILGVSAKAEALTTNAQGLFEVTEGNYDATKYFWGVVRSSAVVESNTATSGSASSLTRTGAGWSVDEFAPDDNKFYLLRITAGTGNGEERVIQSNTTDTITPHRDFVATLDDTSEYEIVEVRIGVTAVYPDQEEPA